MTLAAESWRLREEARVALESGTLERVVALAAMAQEAHATPAGDALLRLGEWLWIHEDGPA